MDDSLMLAAVQGHVLRARIKTPFRLESYCFKEQLDFILDQSPFATAVCSRRSGKTISCAADLIHTAITNQNAVCLYITLSRNNAKKIIWAELIEINRKFNLGGKPNESELSITFSKQRSVIYLSGAKDKSEIEKFRGLAIKLCYIDECQSFRPYIQSLIDDVISAALYDYNGRLRLIGTPGPVPAGYFYDCAHSKEWSHHAWTMFQNPWLEKKSGKTVMELVERDIKRKGVTLEDASIQRECFGRWVVDLNSLVFRYDPKLNHFDETPPLEHWEFVIGVDLGFDDSDAIAVIGWHPKIKEAYLFEEHVRAKQGITELSGQLSRLITKYDPLKVVMDTGGLGKKIAEELNSRFSLGVQAAEKTRKLEFIEILNDALRTRKFFARRDSKFAQDCMLVEWDKESSEPKISDAYHTDIGDAVLYAFREALHWLYEETPESPKAGTPEWRELQEQEMEKNALEQAFGKNEDDIFDNIDWNN